MLSPSSNLMRPGGLPCDEPGRCTPQNRVDLLGPPCSRRANGLLSYRHHPTAREAPGPLPVSGALLTATYRRTTLREFLAACSRELSTAVVAPTAMLPHVGVLGCSSGSVKTDHSEDEVEVRTRQFVSRRGFRGKKSRWSGVVVPHIRQQARRVQNRCPPSCFSPQAQPSARVPVEPAQPLKV
jgi:hypothetical protein